VSRKSNLIHAYTRALKISNKGAYATQQTKLKTMRLIVEDLVLLRCAPHRWQELSDKQLLKLVSFWKTKKTKPVKITTIIKRISTLRKICFLIDSTTNFPSNKELGLQAHNLKQNDYDFPYMVLKNDVLEKIEHPITKTIIEFEMFFGLTKSESIKLSDHSIFKDKITIYRDIAYNHYDRIIPIVTEQQCSILIERKQIFDKYNAQGSLLQITSFAKLSTLYRSELAVLNIEGHSHFRMIYAKDRFEILKKSITKKKAIKILQKELGLTSDRLLKRWIK
jgi:hypothetical protein